jgi:hypothetical protein
VFIEFLEKDLRRSIDYWRSYLKPAGLFNVFFGTQDDLDWIIEAWKPYGHNPGFANDLRGRIAREGNQLNAGAVPSENGSSHLSMLRHTSLNIRFGDYSFITHEFISPNYFDKLIAYSVESKKVTLVEAQKYFNLTAYIWQSISGGLSFGVVIGAIVAYILRPKVQVTTNKSK